MSIPRNPTRTILELDPFWHDIVRWTGTAERNLSDIQPGFPACTPGSGNVGGGSGIGDRTGNTAINRLMADFEDTAVADLARLYSIAGEIAPLLREWRALAVQYSYATPGELLEGRKRRTARPTESKANAGNWCHSCERLGHASPTYKNRIVEKDEPAVPLCSWCYAFVAENRVLPPLTILEAHQRGRYISQDAVKKALKEAAPPEVHKPGKKHKANNEHPTRPSVRRRGPGAVVPVKR
jgi:hypothetical protein